ncbi:MAG: hypothetical protein OSJ73_24300 [Lachnospiraceae bacterium]|jgi:hypothetical protein|nr:hypothetical protein [Lachnospiraceae bacterium]
MEYDINKLRKKLNSYFLGEISKQNLGEWAGKAYYDLLKGGYIECKKIIIYPFLKTISTFHIEANDAMDIYPCSEKKVKKIQDILCGKVDFDFNVEISIPIQVYSMLKEHEYFDKERYNIFFNLRNLIVQYDKNQIKNDFKVQIERIMHLKCQKGTIYGILENRICQCLKLLFGKEKIYKLYVQQSNNDVLFKKLVSYIDSYIGNKTFYLFVTFVNGETDYFIDV